MALLANSPPKRTRLRMLSLEPRGTLGSGKETGLGSGGDEPLIIKVPSTQSVPAIRVQLQAAGVAATELFDVDQAGQITALGGVAGGGLYCTQVALTAAQIIAMNGAPVAILAAPGATKVIVVDAIHFQFKAATQFTGGGVVSFVYHGGAVSPHASSIPAATITSASPSNNILPPLAAVIQPPTNTGIDITNATAGFAAGTGTAIVTVWYTILTLG